MSRPLIIVPAGTLADGLGDIVAADTPELRRYVKMCRSNRKSKDVGRTTLERSCQAAIDRQDLIEDVEWMARGGETTHGAAERLGYSEPASLRNRLDTVGRYDLWERLLRNEITRFGATLGQIDQMSRPQNQKQYGALGRTA